MGWFGSPDAAGAPHSPHATNPNKDPLTGQVAIPRPGTATPPVVAPPDAIAANSAAVIAAAAAAARQRGRAAGGNTLIGGNPSGFGINPPATMQPRALIGSVTTR